MATSITISNAPPLQKASDYTVLREMGIGYIERYGHTLWTDYNTHDPGITLLEALCYAITDLSLRTSLDMKDLLASSYGNTADMQASFMTAGVVLPTCPVSELDYRKLFIDVKGIRNAWLEPVYPAVHVNCRETDARKRLSYDQPDVPAANRLAFNLLGLHRILIDYDWGYIESFIAHCIEKKERTARPLTDAEKDQLRNQYTTDIKKTIESRVRQAYETHRNLGEDLVTIEAVPVHYLMFCADVELTPDAKVGEVYGQILFRVQEYLAPPVKRYTLADMQKRVDADGNPLTIDQIFEGPRLAHGFIADDELEASTLRRVVYTSDLINIIMGIEGVRDVKKVLLNTFEDAMPNTPCGSRVPKKNGEQRWCLHIEPDHQPLLCPEKVALSFYKDIVPVGNESDKKRALARLADLQTQAYADNQKTVDDLPVPVGEVYELQAYRSVANDLPQNYGVGPFGLPASVSVERKAQAKQLKAYLLFFDQLLANYLAQLANLYRLFSADTQPQTYFGQVLTNTSLTGIEELYADYAGLPSVLTNTILAQLEGYADNPVRKNRFLDHLLARFAENFSDYALLMHSLYGERGNEEILEDKANFLNEYGKICRPQAYNYCQPAWQTDNVAGLTRRLVRLTGIRNYQAHGASALTVLDTPPADDPTRFSFRLRDPVSSTVFLQSVDTFATTDEAQKAGQRALLPVPVKARFGISQTAGVYAYSLTDRSNQIVARCPRTFATAEAADADLEEALETLIYGGEAIFLVEHLLLRPGGSPAQHWMAVCTEPNCEHCEPLDPYSFRLSVVLPGYTTRFADVDYRRYLEKIIRLEVPAHLLARICWVSQAQLADFETKYQRWLDARVALCADPTHGDYTPALNEFIDILENLHTIYPSGVLHDCDNEDEEAPIILNRSTLGSLKTSEDQPTPDN